MRRRDHGFADPTRAPIVRKTLKGIQALHPSVEKRATPLQLTQLGQVADWLDGAITAARDRGDQPDVDVRKTIHAATNKSEEFNNFT